MVPFSRACLLKFSSESSELTAKTASVVSSRILDFCKKEGWTLVGPAPSLVERVAGKSRWQLLLYGPDSSKIPLAYNPELWDTLPKGVSLSIDPDPIQL